jgi:sugar phosphate isomerase/epimerase
MSTEGFPGAKHGAEQNEFDAHQFLRENGLESLAGREVMGHTGEKMSLTQAISECAPARKSIEGMVEIAQNLGAEDVVSVVGNYINKLSEEAQTAAPEVAEAIKKDS